MDREAIKEIEAARARQRQVLTDHGFCVAIAKETEKWRIRIERQVMPDGVTVNDLPQKIGRELALHGHVHLVIGESGDVGLYDPATYALLHLPKK